MFRQMLRSKQQLPQAECIALLEEQKRGVLSVLGDDGYPYGMPMNHWYCREDGIVYFHSGQKGHKMDAIKSCHKASFCVLDEGVHEDDSWVLQFRSVIVFGRIRMIEDPEQIIRITRNLSYKFTSDEAHIEKEIRGAAGHTACFALVPEHICGKWVNES